MGRAQVRGKHGHPVSHPASQPPSQRASRFTRGVVRGKEAFEDGQGCHRRDASGRAGSNIPRLSAQHASVIVKQILDIRSGLHSNPPMKPYVEASVLSLQAIADIARYLQGLPVKATPTSRCRCWPPSISPTCCVS